MIIIIRALSQVRKKKKKERRKAKKKAQRKKGKKKTKEKEINKKGNVAISFFTLVLQNSTLFFM